MKGIIKAQFFQIIRDKVVRGMLFVALTMQVLIVMLPIWLDNESVTTAGEFFATQDGVTISFPMFFLIVVTGQICGADFLDKTHNYELMIGHRRHEVYLGRVIPALLVGGVGGAVAYYVAHSDLCFPIWLGNKGGVWSGASALDTDAVSFPSNGLRVCIPDLSYKEPLCGDGAGVCGVYGICSLVRHDRSMFGILRNDQSFPAFGSQQVDYLWSGG